MSTTLRSLVRRTLSQSAIRPPTVGGIHIGAPPSALLRWSNSPFRALSSNPRGGKQLTEAQQRLENQEEELDEQIWGKLNSTPEPRLRSDPPLPPTTHRESWAPASLVAADPAENVLRFTSRMYIDATGEQPEWANKVELVVKVSKLGLSVLEQRRLLAVASRQYNRKRGELMFTCRRYADVARNKMELRATLGKLITDARQNSDAHAAMPDSQLPLAVRSRPWIARDPRAYRGQRPNRFKNASG